MLLTQTLENIFKQHLKLVLVLSKISKTALKPLAAKVLHNLLYAYCLKTGLLLLYQKLDHFLWQALL
jgi:hypothetical protein